MRGQAFLTDACIAFLILLFCAVFSLSVASFLNKGSAEEYLEFMRERRLIDASEKLVSVMLAEYSQNSLKHHELSPDKIRALSAVDLDTLREELLLEEYNISLRITAGNSSLLDMGAQGGAAVKRIALCGGEVCIVALGAE